MRQGMRGVTLSVTERHKTMFFNKNQRLKRHTGKHITKINTSPSYILKQVFEFLLVRPGKYRLIYAIVAVYLTHTNEGDREMNKSAITKTFNKAQNLTAQYSLGFARLHALPVRVRSALNTALLLDGIDSKEIHQKQKAFMESMNDSEFKNWLTLA